VHVWLARAGHGEDCEDLDACHGLLSEDERERASRFRQEKDRHLFVIAHALMRTTLSRYAPLDPKRWSFERNPYGRPSPVLREGFPPLRASLSHTDGLAACAVTLGRDVGVDVEVRREQAFDRGLMEHCLTSEELSALLAMPEEDRESRFLETWTLKEAYLKARGIGMSLGLTRFSINRDGDAPPRVSLSPDLQDDPAQWQLSLFRPTARHQAALAVRRDGADLAVSWRFTKPA
jgi:4'-phosphopantetheinyl transferase